MPPHVPGRGVVGHYFDRCISGIFFYSSGSTEDKAEVQKVDTSKFDGEG